LRKPAGLRRAAWIFIGLLIVAGCKGEPAATPTSLPTPPPPTPTHIPTATPERLAQRLILCTTEPEAVSPFFPAQASSDLLALIQEPPIERVRYGWEPRLVERVPSLAAGDVITRLTRVATGMRYADPLGLIHTYTGTDTIELPQLVVTYTLKQELLWSDNVPITAKDAVLGYHLAQTAEAQGSWRDLVERTARFIAVDDYTLRWEGIPGYLDADYPGFLFPLQPAHRWQGQGLVQIYGDRTPPATGPFKIVAWESGHEVRLAPNPNYSGTPPTLEEVIVRFPAYAPESWYSLLLDGTCDVILPDPAMQTSWQMWTQLGAAGEIVIWADAAPTMLRLDLNVAPEPGPSGTTIMPLADLRVRRALDQCVDREQLTQAFPAEAVVAAEGFIPPSHPADTSSAPAAVNPRVEAMQLLDEAGWRDEDGDGIREAYDVPDIDDGMPLSLTLQFAPQYFITAAYIAADLETCGINIVLEPVDLRQMTSPGPDSPLYGRWFQMALLGWEAEVPQVCGGWLSSRIPTTGNSWQGENFSGFASDAYDQACLRALTAVESEARALAIRQAESLLNAAHTTLFLAWRPFWFVARPNVHGLLPDASAGGTLWNPEQVFIGPEP